MAFRKKWLLEIYTEWIEGDKGRTKALESKVREMLGALNERDYPRERKARPDLQVVFENSVLFLQDMSL